MVAIMLVNSMARFGHRRFVLSAGKHAHSHRLYKAFSNRESKTICKISDSCTFTRIYFILAVIAA